MQFEDALRRLYALEKKLTDQVISRDQAQVLHIGCEVHVSDILQSLAKQQELF